MAQLHLIKHSQGILIPATPETSDFLQSKCKLGAVLEAEYKLVRKPAIIAPVVKHRTCATTRTTFTSSVITATCSCPVISSSTALAW
ncbi:hypothetical protein AE03_00302 [Klebsiella aerogenes MGH 77]|nr:hypothetical protein AE03_00302 [Klebsiella aerogenes MGH 77]